MENGKKKTKMVELMKNDSLAGRCPKCGSRWFLNGHCEICMYDVKKDKDLKKPF